MTTTNTREHPLQACATAITAALADVVDLDPTWLPIDTKADVLIELAQAQEQLGALKARVIAASGDLADDRGARSVASWLATQTRDEPASCAAEEKLAKTLDRKYATLASGWATGAVNRNQVTVITRALDELPRRVGAEVLAAAETELVRLAGLHNPRDLRILGRRILEVVAPDIAEEEERKRLEDEERAARARTRLVFKPLGDGRTRIVADIPDAVAAIFKTALHAYTSPRLDHHQEVADGLPRTDPDTGERIPHDQLLGLAFSALVEHIPTDRLPTQGRTPVKVVATIDHDKLRDDLGAAGLSTGDQISISQLRRLACEHSLLPAVLDGESQVLDLGRNQRLFTGPQRIAMGLAHHQCQARGCTVPAAWCEAHHKNPWVKGGRTDLADGALLCPWHHHRAHDSDYDQAWAPDGTVTFTRLRT
ncbi:HNH endonuclease signature motif containing protein [Nocardioides ferulae]|uniref:HNH endonuclease signature motif containing protein n=1 Tax=Nocardioides ferulae TaxID=2340821 RepID=UPI000EB47191|nr:HNH endonuclease signature motif containing protein [Nocardioides ferulae]